MSFCYLINRFVNGNLRINAWFYTSYVYLQNDTGVNHDQPNRHVYGVPPPTPKRVRLRDCCRQVVVVHGYEGLVVSINANVPQHHCNDVQVEGIGLSIRTEHRPYLEGSGRVRTLLNGNTQTIEEGEEWWLFWKLVFVLFVLEFTNRGQ